MKYFIALATGMLALLMAIAPAHAGTGAPNPGCHEVWTTPPGGGKPVLVEVCP